MNLQRALQLVLQAPGEQTRARIARETGLTSATVSSLISELIDDGFVREGKQAESAGGKRATTLNINEVERLLLVVVARARNFDIGVLSLTGNMLFRKSEPARPGDRLTDLGAALSSLPARFRGHLIASCMQVSGTTDGRTVHESVQLGWANVHLADLLERSLGAPAYVVNNVDAEALAEGTVDEQPCRLRLLLHLGEGIGAAITANGELVHGASGRAGEIGHVRVVVDGDQNRCRCGQLGCFESSCSLSAMLGDSFHNNMDRREVQALAGQGDARERLEAGARAVARALRMMSALLDPAEIVMGGPAPNLGPTFLSVVQEGFDRDPAQGTTPVPIRYATEGLSPFLGAAQFALKSSLGLSLTRPPAGRR